MTAPEAIPELVPQRYEANVPLSRLTRHPANFNQPDIGLLCTLFGALGFAGAVMAQESTGLIIDGHGRLDAAEAKGMTALPVIWCDVDDDTRDRLLASWNESCRRGMNDLAAQVAFLQSMAVTARGLEGCATDGDDLDKMIARLQAQAAGDGPPPAGWTVTVHLPDDAAATEFFALLGAERARSLTWEPA